MLNRRWQMGITQVPVIGLLESAAVFVLLGDGLHNLIKPRQMHNKWPSETLDHL